MNEDLDQRVRHGAFHFLDQLNNRYGEALPFAELRQGFNFDGERVPLIGPQGIFKPKIMELPLTINTSPNSPYNDSLSYDGLLLYMYRGTNPDHHENVGLRKAMELGKPLIYFQGAVPGRYVAAWPVYIVGDDPKNLTFSIAFDDQKNLVSSQHYQVRDSEVDIRRRYKTAEVLVRLHQGVFRERVLKAYKHSCTLCQLKHDQLLDAAHIIPDSEETGEPVVSNGLSLCKIHHAAFDSNILGISPDFIAEIRQDILNETDGPMLRYGLQEMHGKKIWLPRRLQDKPNQDALSERYSKFKAA